MTQLYNLHIMLEYKLYFMQVSVCVCARSQTDGEGREGPPPPHCIVESETLEEERELHFLPTIADFETNYKFCDSDFRLFIDLLMISFQIGENIIRGFRISCNLTLLPLPFHFLSRPAHARTFLSSPVLHTDVLSYHFLSRSAHTRTFLSFPLPFCTRTYFSSNVGYGELAGSLMRVREAFVGRTSKL